MADYLVFRLYGPLCSWGEIAVGESRHTADHPSRSALLGLFAAALGLERSAEQAHRDLSTAWRFGIKLLAPGTLLRDYHTVQAPRRQRNVRHRTRRSELSASNVNTLLSTREYRTDSVSIVAAQLADPTRWTLAGMQAALEQPCFPLCLGRKSCPPALPLAPRIVEAPTLRAALDTVQHPLAALGGLRLGGGGKGGKPPEPVPLANSPDSSDRRLFRMGPARYFWEDGMHLDENAPGESRQNFVAFVRHDQPLSRRRWQFTRRREWAWFAPQVPDQSPPVQGLPDQGPPEQGGAA